MESPALAEIIVEGLPYHILPGRPLRIGRGEDNDVQIDHESVSSHHATICFENGQCLLTDHHSTNGSFVNGQRVIAAPLNPGDQIRVGAAILELRILQSTEQREVIPTTPPNPATEELPASPSAPSPRVQAAFLWWPEGRISRRLIIVTLSLTFVLFSLGAPPIGGVIGAGGLYLWIAFLRWLFINTRQALGSPAQHTSSHSERLQAVVQSVSTQLQPTLKNVQRSTADLAARTANRSKPLLNQAKAKWFKLPIPKRRTLAFGGGAVLLLVLIIGLGTSDEAAPPASSYTYTPSSDASTSDNISMRDLAALALIDQAMQEQRNEMNQSPVYGVPGSQSSGLSSDWHETMCIPCVGRGTITTPSGYVTPCTSCGGRGKVRAAGPQVQSLQKY